MVVGAGLHFPKSFKKFDALAGKKKFPEIYRAWGLGRRNFPKYLIHGGCTSSDLSKMIDTYGFEGLKTKHFLRLRRTNR